MAYIPNFTTSKLMNSIFRIIKVNDNFIYSSDNNKEWMSVDQLKGWIGANINKIGKI